MVLEYTAAHTVPFVDDGEACVADLVIVAPDDVEEVEYSDEDGDADLVGPVDGTGLPIGGPSLIRIPAAEVLGSDKVKKTVVAVGAVILGITAISFAWSR